MIGQQDDGTGRVVAGRYRLVSVRRRGTTGTVWLADDTLLPRQVVVLELGLPASDEERYAALRELRAVAGLGGRHVVRIHDVAMEGDRLWVVREALTGRPLSRILRDDGPLPPLTAAAVETAVTEALALARAAGVVRRCVGTDDVVVTDSGRVVVTGLGLPAARPEPAGAPAATDPAEQPLAQESSAVPAYDIEQSPATAADPAGTPAAGADVPWDDEPGDLLDSGPLVGPQRREAAVAMVVVMVLVAAAAVVAAFGGTA